MTILAATVCSRSGKVVLSRQFREMSKSRVESLLSSFPKLTSNNTQHTTVEIENVRFVYQPLDELYIVLITNRQSNILRDIETLHLFAQVVGKICRFLTERDILKSAFELITAFDELVVLGHQDNISLSQIKTYLDMESHEERIQEIIAQNKEFEAAEERKKKAKQLDVQRRKNARANRAGIGIPPPPSRLPMFSSYSPLPTQNTTSDESHISAHNAKSNASLPIRVKGMQLGKKSKTTNLFEQVRGDLGAADADINASLVPKATVTACTDDSLGDKVPEISNSTNGVQITLTECITAKFTRDGSAKQVDVKGDLQLRITDSAFVNLRLELAVGETHGAQLRCHPRVDRNLFKSSSTVQVADSSRGSFPKNQSLGVVRWQHTLSPTSISDSLPVIFTVWTTEATSDSWSVTIEYEQPANANHELHNILVKIPFPPHDEPPVHSDDAAVVQDDHVEWSIPYIGPESSSGSLDLEIFGSDDAEFFPITISFESTNPLVDVTVANVSLPNEPSMTVPYNFSVRSTGNTYTID